VYLTPGFQWSRKGKRQAHLWVRLTSVNIFYARTNSLAVYIFSQASLTQGAYILRSNIIHMGVDPVARLDIGASVLSSRCRFHALCRAV